jgi:two-component system OmpR family response regulator
MLAQGRGVPRSQIPRRTTIGLPGHDREDTVKLLVIEDDETTGAFIARGLREEGQVVDLVKSGREGLIQATAGTYDVLIVDRMLPEIDGLTLVKTLRGAGNRTPVLFLTALGSVNDRISGLNAGGDDYLVKPFAFGELSARIAALARRPVALEQETVLRTQDLEMDLIARKVTRGGVVIDLLPREFSILEHLLRRKGRVQTRTMLLESIWDIRFDPMTNVVETHISRLRSKVDKPFETELIKTVRGAGYRIEA